MKNDSNGKPFIIYALVCPITLEVKYVGQTTDIEQRVRGTSHSLKQNTPVSTWMKTLGYLRPYKVILQRGTNRRVWLPHMNRDAIRGRRPAGECVLWLSSVMEAKWIKRFRRTVLNRKSASLDVDRVLVNTPAQDFTTEVE